MNELLTKSLAQIVNTNHRAATVFEKYHLDFCCKGRRSLEQACAESKIAPADVISDLQEHLGSNQLNENANYDRLSLSELADHIVNTHHSYVRNESGPLLGYLQKVAAKHGARHPEMLKVLELFTAIKEEMELHMDKEEKILFPRIREAEQVLADGKTLVINRSYIKSPIDMMEQEHDHAGSLLAEIRKLTSNYNPPPDACTTYRLSFEVLQAFELDLHNHVHLENNILFPKALKLFEMDYPTCQN
jgi:regulator of cell morphogenesis and NO signaling